MFSEELVSMTNRLCVFMPRPRSANTNMFTYAFYARKAQEKVETTYVPSSKALQDYSGKANVSFGAAMFEATRAQDPFGARFESAKVLMFFRTFALY